MDSVIELKEKLLELGRGDKDFAEGVLENIRSEKYRKHMLDLIVESPDISTGEILLYSVGFGELESSMRVNILESYNTKLGKILRIESTGELHKGDTIVGDDESVYMIKQVILPADSKEDGSICILVA